MRLLVALTPLLLAGDAWAATSDLASWPGRFRLDEQRSDPVGPMLEALETPWYARVAARSSRPTLVVESRGSALVLRFESGMGDRVETLQLDGKKRPGKDRFGRAFEESSHRDGDAVVVERSLTLGSGARAKVETRWTREGDDLVNDVVVRAGSKAPVRLERVFVRTE